MCYKIDGKLLGSFIGVMYILNASLPFALLTSTREGAEWAIMEYMDVTDSFCLSVTVSPYQN